MKLQKILISLEKQLEAIEAPVLKKLNAGINSREVLQKEGLPDLPAELHTMYQWKNGTNTGAADNLGKLWLFNFGIFLPVEKAIQLYKEAGPQIAEWDMYKFPLFVSGGGEYYFLECDPGSTDYGKIYYHSIGCIDIDVIITKYDSLQAFFMTILKCFERKAYQFGGEGDIAFDIPLEKQIAAEINPASAYWKLP